MDKQKFLELIRQIESSGGKNVNHRVMASGTHKGQAAMGEYGIMPKTAEEFIGRRKRRGQFGPDEALMEQMSPKELKEFLAGQDRIEQNLAGDIAEHALRRSKGDDEKAAYMWNMGHNKDASDIDSKKLDKSDYVNKFRRLKELVRAKKQRDETLDVINKTMP
jgi:hypothetical protein